MVAGADPRKSFRFQRTGFDQGRVRWRTLAVAYTPLDIKLRMTPNIWDAESTVETRLSVQILFDSDKSRAGSSHRFLQNEVGVKTDRLLKNTESKLKLYI